MGKRYEAYKVRRGLWIECLGSDDKHGIWQQIWHATWNAAAYRVLNKAAELAPEAPEGGRQLNGMMYNLLRESFFEAECSRIRRLVEVEPHGLDKGPRAVFSLGTLLKDMEDHAHLITPDHVVSASEESGSSKWWLEEQRGHLQELVRYGGATGSHVPRSFFVSMRDRMGTATEKVARYVDKNIAHSATPTSRAAVPGGGPSFLEVMDTLRVIHETAEFISVYLLDGAAHGHLPLPPANHLVYLDRALAPTEEALEALQMSWDHTGEEVEEWHLRFEQMLEELVDE